MKKLLLCAFLLCAVLGSCKKGTPLPAYKQIRARVWDSGSVAVDGCGWLIQVDSTAVYPEIRKVYYHPENLADGYKIHGMHVMISYKVQGTTFACGFANHGPAVIMLESIEKNIP